MYDFYTEINYRKKSPAVVSLIDKNTTLLKVWRHNWPNSSFLPFVIQDSVLTVKALSCRDNVNQYDITKERHTTGLAGLGVTLVIFVFLCSVNIGVELKE